VCDPEGNRVGLTHYPEEVVVIGITATP
jgi:hypothetical protein